MESCRNKAPLDDVIRTSCCDEDDCQRPKDKKKKKDIITSMVDSFDEERKVEKKFFNHFCHAIHSREDLLTSNISLLHNMLEYAEFKMSSLWKYRFCVPTDNLNVFKVQSFNIIHRF